MGTACTIVAPDTTCKMEWATKYACATSSFGWGWTFNVCFACAIVLYIAAGLYYNRTTRGMSWGEAFPHRDFWRELPVLLKEGILFTTKKLGSLSKGKSSGSDKL